MDTERIVYAYFRHDGIEARYLPYSSGALYVAWEDAPPSHPRTFFSPIEIPLDERDQRILVAFDGNIIPHALPRNARILARWKWPEFSLCVNNNHPYVHVAPPAPAWKADSGHVIVPIERYLVLVGAGNFAFFRWDEKTLRRMVTFCKIRIRGENHADVAWYNTSP